MRLLHFDTEKEGNDMGNYGKELILDLHGCDSSTFNRDSIAKYCAELCDLIDMQAQVLHFWDDVGVAEEERQTEAHTTGTSAVQFILTSNITIHTLDILESVYINIFSCKDFDADVAAEFTLNWFGGVPVQQLTIDRL